MRLQFVLMIISTLLRIGVAARDANPRPGVGISLSSGYASVSALFPNGSYVDIAKVEGDPSYRAYMLGSRADGSREETNKAASASYCPFSPRICRQSPFDQSRNPLAPIFSELVAAAEDALETTIDSVAVSVYDMGAIDHRLARDDVNTALTDLGVNGHKRLDHVARQLIPSLGIGGNCSEPYILPENPDYYHKPGQILLTIEYTRDSMTAGLWKEECGTIEMTRRWNSAQLGFSAMQTCRESVEDENLCEETFISALRNVSEDPTRDKHEKIGPVLVFGECADDDAMLNMLHKVLEEQFPNGGSVDLSRVRSFASNPAFAGSRSMAATSWAAMNSQHEAYHVDEL